MNTMELVHLVSAAERADNHAQRASTARYFSELIRPVRHAILSARQHLLAEQRSDGSWRSARHSDASLASQLVFLLTYLESDESQLIKQAAASILQDQLPTGGWSLVPDGPADLSTSVQAYFALKLSGEIDASDVRLASAREAIRSLGGADAADVTTRFYFALFGQVDYDHCPAIQPASILFMGARRLTPLAAVWTHREVRRLPAERGIRELFIRPPTCWTRRAPAGVGRRSLRFIGDALLRVSEALGYAPLRKSALNRVHLHVLRNIAAAQIEQLDFSQLVWHSIAIHALGYSTTSAEQRTCVLRLHELTSIDDCSNMARPQLRSQPTADTVAVLCSVTGSGASAAHPCIAAAIKWLSDQGRFDPESIATDLAGMLQLLSNEKMRLSDADEALPPAIGICRRRPNGPHRRHGESNVSPLNASIIERLLQAQQSDGGWALGVASSADVTGAVLEAIGPYQGAAVTRAKGRAAHFLCRAQRADGSWDSETGVRLIHGTSLAVRGLLAAGCAPEDDAVAAGINWLLVHQLPSGGWGETASPPGQATHDEFLPGEPTASQTAWALMALVAAGRANSAAARRAIEFLLETQRDDGHWAEPQFALYDAASKRWCRSELHTTADALLALSRWAVAAAAQAEAADDTALRVVSAAVDD